MIFRLIILNGERRGERITVAAEPMRIGRDEASEIRFADPEIASLHAEISHREQGLVIRDLGSMNRILVNNRETREAQLKHGDVVEVGRTRFLVQAYVQAEVIGEAEQARRRLWKNLSILAAILVIALLAIPRCKRGGAPPPAKPAREKKVAGRTARTALVPLGAPVRPATNAVPPAATPAAPAVQPPPPVAAPPAEPGTNAAPPAPERPADLVEAEALLHTSRAERVAAEVDLARKEIEAAAQALLQSRVQEMLDTARSAASNQSPEATEEALAGIQRVAPDFAEAHAERARLLASRGWLDPAIAQWREVARCAAEDSPLATQARDELKRLAGAKEHFVFPFTGRIRIVNPELTKFPETAEYQEMRVLSFTLEAAAQEKELRADAIKVSVQFYDRDAATGLIHPTSATLTPPALPPGPWLAESRKPLSASYVLPPGVPRKGPFYGCLIRVRYHGALQDEWMQPKDLPADVQMDTPAAPAPPAARP